MMSYLELNVAVGFGDKVGGEDGAGESDRRIWRRPDAVFGIGLPSCSWYLAGKECRGSCVLYMTQLYRIISTIFTVR